MAKGRAKDAPKKKAGKKRGFWGKLFRFIGFVILIGFVLSILTTVAYKWINPPITPLMVIRKVQLGAPIEHEWRDLEEISPYMVQCAIASEDNNFLGHKGFDWGAIDRAIEERESGRRKRGASTISQQTAKNVFLWPKSSWVRKGFEVYYTFLIENIWGKERIMEIYLNERCQEPHPSGSRTHHRLLPATTQKEPRSSVQARTKTRQSTRKMERYDRTGAFR